MMNVKRTAFASLAALALVVSAMFVQAAPPAPPPEPQGVVTIESTPDHAEIVIDRATRGQTPAELTLAPGRHLLVVRADGHRPEYRTIDVDDGARISLSVALRPYTSVILASSDPEGAEVTVDGVSYGPSPALVSSVPIGTHRVGFSMPGYKDKTVEVQVVDRSPRKVSATLASDTATLHVTCAVPEAQLFVNGVSAGQGTATVSKIPAGEVEVKAEAKGYRPYVASLSLAEGEESKLDIQLDMLPSSVQVVTSPPGANVRIDGVLRGTSPLTIAEIAPGNHGISVSLEGHDPDRREVVLEAGVKGVVDFTLVPNTGSLLVTTEPEGVTLVVDGRDAGVTQAAKDAAPGVSAPLVIDGLVPGVRKVQAIRPGYFGKDADVVVERGKTATLSIKLKRKFLPDYEVHTALGVFKGMLESKTGEGVKMETRPGVTTFYPAADIISQGPVKAQ
ncbi:MAG: PEGA domain-containing protein [Kiritimatiellae bacterium]|nr:PEGA domain-containing protein [Kiritimatiellia bacterium]